MFQAGVEEVGKQGKTSKGPGVAFSGPEVADMLGNIQPDGSPQTNEVMQAYQIVHGYVAAQVQARNAGEWYDDESGDDSGDESDDEIGKGMLDIRQLTAQLPTQAKAAEGSAASSDPAAGVIFTQA